MLAQGLDRATGSGLDGGVAGVWDVGLGVVCRCFTHRGNVVATGCLEDILRALTQYLLAQ